MEDFGLGKVVTKVGGEVVEKVAPEWAKPLTRAVFGTNAVPKGAAEVLNKTSKIQADTFTKGIDFDAGLREPLEKLYTLAGEGRTDAYELLTIVGRDFKEEALNAKKLKQAQTQYANLQRQIDDARAGQTGDKMRKTSATIQNPTGPATHRTGQKLKPVDEADRYVTEGHHAIILGEGQKIPLRHKSAELITPGEKSLIIDARERIMGIESGNAEANIADVLETMTKESRTARLAAIGEQTDGVIDSKTANDGLGMTGYKPRMLDETGNAELDRLGLEVEHFSRLQQQDPTLTTQRYMDTEKSPTTGRAYAEGQFQDIRVYKPGTVHKTGKNAPKPLGIVEINNAKDHANKWNLVFDMLDDSGIDTTKARQQFNIKAQKIDRNLDIYGEDHQLTHRLIEALKEKEGTAFYEIEQLGPEGVYNLPLEEAIKLDIRQIQEMETVLANVLEYRYGIVKDLFYEYNPTKGKDGFELLDADEKAIFFRKNVNTIAVRGKVSQVVTLDNALTPPKTFNNHITDTFGWRPQSLHATIQEIEAIAKELAEKVQTTQPIPGVE